MPGSDAVYTHGHHESVLRSHRWRTTANSAAYLLDSLAPGRSVLDVGCGPGTITAGLAALVAPGTVTAVDAAEGVLDEARATVAARGLTNVRFLRADVMALGFPAGSFDVVHAHQVLQHLADPVGALREMRRVCRPGGVVAARDSDYGAMSWYPEVPGLSEWRELYRRVARDAGGEPDAGRRLLSWARRADLTGVTASAGVWCFAGETDRAWWSGLWAERTVASSYASLAVGGGHTDRAGLERVAAAWHEWGAHPDGWFSVPHGEILCRV
ncbi:class I SAM-dependent methyltransferase [Streptomyces sp. TRM 70361]|uniref:class I SAM-dependent methyltransferase n=1 Tax=Streptomyces sp. TRM 70361 TaxID=3116553 RepID=UPI002E7ABD68|nr:class I SAM-dependent methyltransferase [Streptomyces sp. TRM 70361]MEE1941912.1 class I SAM-dependent methyltransferase [Streptomyces sp. TRM 70361]